MMQNWLRKSRKTWILQSRSPIDILENGLLCEMDHARGIKTCYCMTCYVHMLLSYARFKGAGARKRWKFWIKDIWCAMVPWSRNGTSFCMQMSYRSATSIWLKLPACEIFCIVTRRVPWATPNVLWGCKQKRTWRVDSNQRANAC